VVKKKERCEKRKPKQPKVEDDFPIVVIDDEYMSNILSDFKMEDFELPFQDVVFQEGSQFEITI